MRFLLSTTLALGLALAGSVAYAQAFPEQDQPDPNIQGNPEGMTTPELSPGEQQGTDEFGQPQQPQQQQPQVQRRTESQSTESVETQPATPEDRAKINKQESETGAYGAPSYMTSRTEKEKEEGPGFELMAGGGIFNYANSAARDVTKLGADYTARLGIGTRKPISLEVGYIGTAQAVQGLGAGESADLVSNGVEGVGRLNLMTGTFRPYILGGAAWKRYNLVNKNFGTSDVISNSDSVIEFPVGAGVAYHFSKFILDARGDYRFATDEQLLGAGATSRSLDNWDINLKAGIEF